MAQVVAVILSFKELIATARTLAGTRPALIPIGAAPALGHAVLELFGEAQPCGMEAPPIVSFGDGTCGVLVDDRADALTPDEVGAYCAMLMRQADEARERN